MNPKKDNLDIDVDLVVNNVDYGDWKLIYHLLRNMDALVFTEFLAHLTELLKKEKKKIDGGDSSLELATLLKDDNDNPNRESSPKKKSPSDEFLALNDGNYLQVPRQSQI